MAGWAKRWLASGGLSDGRVQYWAVDAQGRLWSTWQEGIDWVYEGQHAATFHATALAVAPLSDKRLQLWSVDDSGHIWSCWKSTTASNAPWTFWASQWTPQLPSFKAVDVAAAPLSDGRLQFWAVANDGRIWSCWKSTTASNAPWTSWAAQWTPQLPGFKAVDVAVAPLSDGRLQFWAIDNSGRVWSCWKSTTTSNAPWTPWTLAWISDAPSFTAQGITATRLADKRLQVWVTDANGVIRTTFKSTTASSAAWSNWALAFPIQKQEQTNWCWAGCSTATAHFFDPASSWSQCKVANAELGQTACCTNPGPCNVYGYLNQALNIVGHFQGMASTTEPDATITAQVNAGLPLGVRVQWSGGGAHFIMVVGGGPNDMVLVKDPIYGMSYIPYNTLATSYQGSGTWTHSYFTKA